MSVSAGPVRADDTDPLPGEGGADIATPGREANRQIAEGQASAPAITPQAVVSGIDDFRYDDLMTEGTAAEVCYGQLRSGTLGTFQALTSRFGGTAGTLYACRERYAVQERPECNGQSINPTTNPTFYSDCWSNHAQGRALDIMVGNSGGGYNQSRGNAIVNFLLSTDSAGNVNANARRLGVQQILWNDKCWNSDGDRGITSAITMRKCGYGHFDHVHIDLTLPGADGQTSWWGYSPSRQPTVNSLWFEDAEVGAWEWRTWLNLVGVSSASGLYPARFSQYIRGDWNADGVSNELFAWAPTTGEWRVVDGTSGALLRQGTASPAVDQFVNGDFDRDGLMNELILLDTETGYGTLWTWLSNGVIGRSQWRWGGGWDRLVPLDGNSDGRVDETYLYDRETGVWYVHTWAGESPYYLNSGQFANGWDDVINGDLDAQGNLDEIYMRDRETGWWAVVSWASSDTVGSIPTVQLTGRWLPDWDNFVMGDWDTDGRVDDMYLYDNANGGWTMITWHRYQTRYAIISSYVPGLDTFLSGTFG